MRPSLCLCALVSCVLTLSWSYLLFFRGFRIGSELTQGVLQPVVPLRDRRTPRVVPRSSDGILPTRPAHIPVFHREWLENRVFVGARESVQSRAGSGLRERIQIRKLVGQHSVLPSQCRPSWPIPGGYLLGRCGRVQE